MKNTRVRNGFLKRIGITQRASSTFHGQPHDCLDQAWTDLLLGIGYVPLPLPNLAEHARVVEGYLSGLALSGLLLSGGNDIGGLGHAAGSEVSVRRDTFERAAIAWARSTGVPVIGICRGMQLLNVVLGGSLVRVEEHAGTRHTVRRLANNGMPCFSSLPQQFEVNSYHNYGITREGLARELVPVVADECGYIEAFAHSDEQLAAIMWHPERAKPFNPIDVNVIERLISG